MIAIIIGAGKPKTVRLIAITNVFLIVVRNMGLLKYILKYLKPAQDPPVRPLRKSKSLKANCTPYMGI
jgi:hypothetical protein